MSQSGSNKKLVDFSRNEIRLPRYKTQELSTDFQLRVKGSNLSILDISESGLSISPQTEWPFEGDREVDCDILVDGKHVIYSGRIERINTNEKAKAFRFVTNPIQRHLFEGVESVNGIKKEIESKAFHDRLPSEFKAFVLELRHFLSCTKAKLDDLDKRLRVEPTQVKDSYLKAVEITTMPWFLEKMLDFSRRLNDLDSRFDPDQKAKAIELFRDNVLEFYTHSDFVLRSIEKPQGYAGDYVLMNKIYDNELVGASTFSKLIYHWGVNEVSSQAVRYRRGLFANMMRGLESQEKINVASVACGPARELCDFLNAADPEKLKNFSFYLLDQDHHAVLEAKRNLTAIKLNRRLECNLHFIPLSVRDIINESPLTQSLSELEFDLIYSAGLYDYLTQKAAGLLTGSLFKWLKMNGSLVVGNYNRKNPSHAIGEYVGNWSLILRDESEMSELVPSEATHFLHYDEHKVNIYLEIVKDAE